MALVGIIPNPASGKDIRRLVAHGSVFDNQEKVRIVRRIMLGLEAAGIDGICFMPDYFGIVERALSRVKINVSVFPLNMKLKRQQEDSTEAARLMAEIGADCIVTLGGDGTNRAVAKGSIKVPILPISTGTNNVFPSMIEGTIAGLAAGLVANGKAPLDESAFHSTMLEVVVDGKAVDLALVDAVVIDDPFIGSRAVWDMSKVRQLFLNRCGPNSIGLSTIGGVYRRIEPDEPAALCLDLGEDGIPVTAAVAPGMIREVRIAGEQIIKPGEEIEVSCVPSVLALDGEREVDVKKGRHTSVRLRKDGPVVVNVAETMESAMRRGIFAPEMLNVESARGAAIIK